MFGTLEPYQPRPAALVHGGLLAVAVLCGVVLAIGHGGKVRSLLIGARRPGTGLLAVDRASVTGADLSTTVVLPPVPADPLLPLARSYFQVVRVLGALDADRDFIVSPWEIVTAPAALRRLDTDHDSELSPEECGFQPRAASIPPDVLGRARREFMRVNPVLAVLDADHDGVISAAEIANASAALKKLDRNRDGFLTPDEVLPDRAETSAGMLMSRLDRNDDGVLSAEEQSAEEAEPLRELLRNADRNGDGVVTREELLRELRLRIEAVRQLDRARRTVGVR
jgi:Ca2+-binding EF-hand superfamily protein